MRAWMRAKRRFIAQVPVSAPCLARLLPGELRNYNRFPARATGPGAPGRRRTVAGALGGCRNFEGPSHRLVNRRYPGAAPPSRPPTMRSLSRTLLLVAALGGAAALPAAAQTGGGGSAPGSTTPAPPPPTPRLIVDRPTKHVFIKEGSTGRLLLGGRWYFRLDDQRVGEGQGFFRQRSLSGWSAVRVPHNWNAGDAVEDRQSVGWYRKEFGLPKLSRALRKARLLWRIRFESANAQAKVWLNGRVIGRHIGGYFPFEVALKGLRKKRRNRLVVKVSSLRQPTDLTHWRFFGQGGWWNFGGLLREVYVRPIDRIDIQSVKVLPRLRCVRCAARVGVEMVVRNVGHKDRRVRLA